MAKNYGSESKGDLPYFDPDKITVVTDPGHPLFDPNALLAPHEPLVRSILQCGVLQPIVIRENGRHESGRPVLEVVAGRKRLIAIREANRQLVAAGKEPLTIPAVVRRDAGDADTARVMLVAENEIRLQDPPSVRAGKALRMEQSGMKLEAIATAFGIGVAATRHLIALGGLDKASRKAIDEGTLPLPAATKLAALPETERAKSVAAAKQGGDGAKRAAAALTRAAKGRTAPARSYVRAVRTKREIEDALHDALATKDASASVLEWVLGKRETLS